MITALQSYGRLFSDKYTTIAQFAERFNASMQSDGYSVDLEHAVWERVEENAFTLTAVLNTPAADETRCIITVYAREQPSFQHILDSLRLEERVPLSTSSTDSALVLPAYTIFELFTPDYVHRPNQRNGSGYPFGALWQVFTESLQESRFSKGIPYYPVPLRGKDHYRADVFHIEIQPAEGGIIRTLDWYWE